MQDLINWLNTNAGAVSAVAATVGAIATVVIAVLTISTVALYRLEKRREHGRKGSLAGHLIRLMNHFRTSADMLEEVIGRDPHMANAGRDAVRFILEENERRRRHVEELFDRAAATKMEVTAALDAALVLVIGVQAIGDVVLRTSGGSPELEQAGRQMIAELRDIAGGFQRAYRSLPSTDRRWANGEKDYDVLVHEFIGPTRDRMRRSPGTDTNRRLT